MNFELLPIDETIAVLRTEMNPVLAFRQIVNYGEQRLPSKIWDEYKNLDIERDIKLATEWMVSSISEFPNSTGIYLGLDTLNMDDGNGTNVEIGFSEDCDPSILNDEWTYDIENYGEGHLIEGLNEVSDTFINEDKWTDDERSFTEYLIFLGYSGVVLREALKKANINHDYLSNWGFHDGDMFFLIQKKGGLTIITPDTEN